MELVNCISIKDISKQYKKQTVLKDINFTVKEGEIFGLLGPSGAGKTTLIRLIMGMEAPKEGSIEIYDKKVPNSKIIEEIGYTAQADALYTDLSGYENLKFYCQLYKVPKKEWKVRMEKALSVVNLNDEGKKIVSNYSGGMKRRLSLAISLLHNPKILILDEPTVGMDPVLRQQIWNEFYKLKKEGVTIVITTHVMDEADKCDRVAMIREGRCISVGEPKNLTKNLGCENLEEVFLKLGGYNNEN